MHADMHRKHHFDDIEATEWASYHCAEEYDCDGTSDHDCVCP